MYDKSGILSNSGTPCTIEGLCGASNTIGSGLTKMLLCISGTPYTGCGFGGGGL